MKLRSARQCRASGEQSVESKSTSDRKSWRSYSSTRRKQKRKGNNTASFLCITTAASTIPMLNPRLLLLPGTLYHSFKIAPWPNLTPKGTAKETSKRNTSKSWDKKKDNFAIGWLSKVQEYKPLEVRPVNHYSNQQYQPTEQRWSRHLQSY